MPSLAEFQERTLAALTGGEADDRLLSGLRSDGIALERRLDVYRNNVFHSLGEALKSAFPVVCRLVGDDFFKGAARAFLDQNGLPAERSLVGFGAGFPEFLERFAPAAGLAYLPDVARLELLWLNAYHAADAAPLAAEDFARVDPADAGNLKLILHPSTAWLASAHPVASLWVAHQDGGTPQGIDLGEAQTALVARPGVHVSLRRIGKGEGVFLAALKAGDRLGEAAGAALAADNSFDLQEALASFIGNGVFSGLQRAAPTQKRGKP